MSPMIILWIVWAGVLAILLILLAYRGTLTRYEEKTSSFWTMQAITRTGANRDRFQVRQDSTVVRIATGATCVLSACILGIYVWDAVCHIMM